MQICNIHTMIKRNIRSYCPNTLKILPKSIKRFGVKHLMFWAKIFNVFIKLCYIETISTPSATETTVAISPGTMNEWLRRYFPILVVPVVSKFIAAITVG